MSSKPHAFARVLLGLFVGAQTGAPLESQAGALPVSQSPAPVNTAADDAII
jgi:hypothetical protein